MPPQRYFYRGCGRSFNEGTNKIFDKSKLKIREWSYLIKESQWRSLYSIALDLERKYEHVWRNVREMWDLPAKKVASKLKRDAKVNETYATAGGRAIRGFRGRGTKVKGRLRGEQDSNNGDH